jgi:hypothetical protein
MRTFADKYDWLPIDTAPWEEDVTLLVTDGRGEPYRIPYPCKLTASGWVNSPKGTLLEVTAMNWKPYRLPPNDERLGMAVVQAHVRTPWPGPGWVEPVASRFTVRRR